jgi:2-polyprenyl-3-methyl-5-hydroxy-6-metoxy-1,4-benzoquinol methylase
MSIVHYTACPVCGSRNIDPLLTVPDHSVSKELFVLWQCSQCTLRFTQDVPDEDSIGSYYKSEDYISHTDTDKGLINKLYQRARTITLQQKLRLITTFTGLQKGAVLDMGAGTGAFLATMQKAGWQATGIEPDADARAVAKKTFGVTLAEIEQLDLLPPASFDAITLWHVLEHVHQLHPYIYKLKRALKDNGKLFIAVPNYTAGDASIYDLYWAAYDVPRHLYHFTPKSIEVLMQQHGLQVKEKKGMWLDAFYISLLSSKYKNGKSNWLAAGFNGLRSNVKAILDQDKCSSVIYIIEKFRG